MNRPYKVQNKPLPCNDGVVLGQPHPGFRGQPIGARDTTLAPAGGAQGCWPRARPRLEAGLQRAGARGQQACRLGRVTSHSPRVEKGVQRASEGVPQ